MSIKEKQQKVIVIGGGLSGLTAARQLLKIHPNICLTVLQALDRVGGRTSTIDFNGCHFDLGAEYIGLSQSHVVALAQESGNPLLDAFHQGKKIIQLDKNVYTYTASLPDHLNQQVELQLQKITQKINSMAKQVPLNDPINCQFGLYWDSMTTQYWLNQNVKNNYLKLTIEILIQSTYGGDPREISFLYFLWYVHQSRDFQNLLQFKNGLQQKVTKYGTQHMSKYLAKQISKLNGIIQLGVQVISIAQRQNKCFVKCRNGKNYESDYLIIACAPWQVNRIQFQPKLSAQRTILCQRSFMGTYMKIMILYKKAYWKQKGLSGEIITDCYDSPLLLSYDCSKTNDKGQIQPALVVFIGGHIHRYWKQFKDLQNVLIRKISELVKQPEMLNPVKVIHEIWENIPTIGGAPTGLLGPGVLTQLSNLKKPEKKIHWAGTELATYSTGYMDGAIESGKRVAMQVSQRLRGIEMKKENKVQTINKQWGPYELERSRKLYSKL